MYVKEIWRYPAKSMAGERVTETEVTGLGLAGDRQILVIGAHGRVITARTHPKLLGLKASLSADGAVTINGHSWNSPQARELVQLAAGPGASLTHYTGPERFDILPLLVATDGAIEHMRIDGRRLRPNLIIGGVEGLEERQWPGRRLRIGTAVLHKSNDNHHACDQDSCHNERQPRASTFCLANGCHLASFINRGRFRHSIIQIRQRTSVPLHS